MTTQRMTAEEFNQIPVGLKAFSQKPERTAGHVREDLAALTDSWEAIIDGAAAAGRQLNSTEVATCADFDRKAKRLNRELETLTAAEMNSFVAAVSGSPAATSKPQVWKDQNGKDVFALGPKDRLSDLPRKSEYDPQARIGDLIRAAITGDRSRCSTSIKLAMSENASSGGGYLVPEELSRTLIDKARARSVVVSAGARTVSMSSETLSLARVSGDPTIELKTENSAFTGSDFTFDSILLNSYTIGTLLTSSRELAEDAPNFVDQIEAALANWFAAALDSLAINGISSTHADGILDWSTGNTGDIGETGSVGSILWEDFHTAAVGVRLANHEPNAAILNPDVAGDLAILAAGDGVNSSKSWLGPPPSVSNLLWLPTIGISTASAIVGDFTQLVFGVRQGMLIEVSKEAGNAFSKHQVLIKLTWRGDVAAFHRDAFWRLVGITT